MSAKRSITDVSPNSDGHSSNSRVKPGKVAKIGIKSEEKTQQFLDSIENKFDVLRDKEDMDVVETPKQTKTTPIILTDIKFKM